MTERLMNFPKEKSIQSRYETYKKIINLHNQRIRYLRNNPSPLFTQSFTLPEPLSLPKNVSQLKIDEICDEKDTLSLPIVRDENGNKVITLISSRHTQYSLIKDEDCNVKLILKKY